MHAIHTINAIKREICVIFCGIYWSYKTFVSGRANQSEIATEY